MIAMRFLILDVVLPHTSPEISALRIRETIHLIHTYSSGLGVVDHIVQQRMHPDSTTYIGSGKVQEVFDLIKKDGIRYVVLNDIVQPGQIFELKKVLQKAYFEIEVWDRVDLILKIFEKHARTSEARMQIELAAMRHMGPRIFGMGLVLSRQGGGIGAKGLGETNTERMKRHWREEIQATQDKLKKLNTDRLQRMQRRRELGMKTVAIVGYTNAGKSSLFNALTGKKNLSKDALFATLDSTLGKLKRSTAYDPTNPAPVVLVSDTIGFISNLPPRLIEAFKSTLLETIHADLLIHVIDASDPEIDRKISVVQETLKDLEADTIPQITVLNKIDLPAARTLEEIKSLTAHLDPLYLSAADGGGVKELCDRVLKVLNKDEA